MLCGGVQELKLKEQKLAGVRHRFDEAFSQMQTMRTVLGEENPTTLHAVQVSAPLPSPVCACS